MGLLNDIYDAADQAKTAQEQRTKKEKAKVIAKQKTEAKMQHQNKDNFGLL
jgi:hypothetical protein